MFLDELLVGDNSMKDCGVRASSVLAVVLRREHELRIVVKTLTGKQIQMNISDTDTTLAVKQRSMFCPVLMAFVYALFPFVNRFFFCLVKQVEGIPWCCVRFFRIGLFFVFTVISSD